MPPPAKRQKIYKKNSLKASQPDELSFDFDARADYLTGFQKRKQQRIKQAREKAIKEAKAQKIEDRKQLREQRQQDLDSHVEAVNAIIKKQQGGGSEEEEEDDDEDEEWQGLDGDAQGETTKSSIPMEGLEDEYVDEDRYTTVTVEPMSVHDDDNDGDDDSNEDGDEDEGKPAEDATDDDGKKKKRIWTKEKPPSEKKKKPKKSKFRYESKAERKSIRTKQSLKNKAQARARKGE